MRSAQVETGAMAASRDRVPGARIGARQSATTGHHECGLDEGETVVKRKKEKGYWVKRQERFSDGSRAKSRAGALRTNEHVSHVRVEERGDDHVVTYSVARWYVEEMRRAGVEL